MSYMADISEVFEVGSAQVEVFTYKKLTSTMIQVSTLIQRQEKAETEIYAEIPEDN